MNMQRLLESIKSHEGRRETAYRDSLGVWTIGYGHNLETRPLSDTVIEMLLGEDLEQAISDARSLVPDFDQLDDPRQEVLVEMAFNLGRAGLASFKRMLAAVKRRDYQSAADEMLSSMWRRQVGVRAEALAERMRG